MSFLKTLDRYLLLGEKSLLVFAVLLMIAMAVTQIILRNFFGFGIVWAEPLVRVLVLWAAFVGAMLAAREGRHIRIDAVLHLLPLHWQSNLNRLLNVFAACLCCLAAYYCAVFVASEMEYSANAFAQVPSWMCAVILPVAFAIMGLRYFIMVFIATPDQELGK